MEDDSDIGLDAVGRGRGGRSGAEGRCSGVLVLGTGLGVSQARTVIDRGRTSSMPIRFGASSVDASVRPWIRQAPPTDLSHSPLTSTRASSPRPTSFLPLLSGTCRSDRVSRHRVGPGQDLVPCPVPGDRLRGEILLGSRPLPLPRRRRSRLEPAPSPEHSSFGLGLPSSARPSAQDWSTDPQASDGRQCDPGWPALTSLT